MGRVPRLTAKEEIRLSLMVQQGQREQQRAFQVADALQDLSERERYVLQLRYGLLGGTSHSLKEVGEILHVSRERVRQIEVQALQKLRVKSSDQLKDFLN